MEKKNENKITWFTWASIAIGLAMIAISVYAVVRDPSLSSEQRSILIPSAFLAIGFFMAMTLNADEMTDDIGKFIMFAALVATLSVLITMISTPVGEIKPVVFQWFAATSYGITLFMGVTIGR